MRAAAFYTGATSPLDDEDCERPTLGIAILVASHVIAQPDSVTLRTPHQCRYQAVAYCAPTAPSDAS